MPDMKHRKTMRAIWLLVLAVLVIAFVSLWWEISNRRIQAHLTEARGNLRSMSMALFEFESAYGAFPNPASTCSTRLIRHGRGKPL